jgi:hypothetical protein
VGVAIVLEGKYFPERADDMAKQARIGAKHERGVVDFG